MDQDTLELFAGKGKPVVHTQSFERLAEMIKSYACSGKFIEEFASLCFPS